MPSGFRRYFRTVLRSYPVNSLMAETLSPVCFISSRSCTSFPLSTLPHFLPDGVDAGIHHLGAGEFSTGTTGIFAPAVTYGAVSGGRPFNKLQGRHRNL